MRMFIMEDLHNAIQTECGDCKDRGRFNGTFIAL